MKRVFLFLIVFGFLTLPGYAQQKDPKTKSAKIAEPKKHKAKIAKHPKAGKSNPNEKGSGMTVAPQDQPRLDTKPNPAATVPSRDIRADENQNPAP